MSLISASNASRSDTGKDLFVPPGTLAVRGIFGGGGEPLHADQLVHRLGCRQLMADRTEPAQALHDERHFPVGTALDEFLEAAKLDDVEERLMDMVPGIEQQRDPGLPLD